MDMKRSPRHAGLRHLALNVRDLDAMKRFYVDLLGFAIEWEPDADNVYCRRASTISRCIARRHAAGRAAPPRRRAALDHLGLIVRTPDEVDRWAAFLESHGVTIDAQPRTHRDGARSCYFRDPDGNQHPDHPPSADQREESEQSARSDSAIPHDLTVESAASQAPGAYIRSTYSLTIRRAREARRDRCGSTSLTVAIQRRGMPRSSRS